MLRSPLRAFIMEWHIGSGCLSPETRPTVSPGMYTHIDTHRHTEKASYKTKCRQPSHKSHLIFSESVFSGFRCNKCTLQLLLPGVHMNSPWISNIFNLTIILFFFYKSWQIPSTFMDVIQLSRPELLQTVVASNSWKDKQSKKHFPHSLSITYITLCCNLLTTHAELQILSI